MGHEFKMGRTAAKREVISWTMKGGEVELSIEFDLSPRKSMRTKEHIGALNFNEHFDTRLHNLLCFGILQLHDRQRRGSFAADMQPDLGK